VQSVALDLTFSALADPTRRAILNHLSKQEASVLELAEPFKISLPAISKHIRVLENANLVSRKKEGRVHRISLNPAPLRDASEWIEYYRDFWQHALDGFQRYIQLTGEKRKVTARRRKKLRR
jgi:DNA-binding transcriptional ArsR family regulator